MAPSALQIIVVVLLVMVLFGTGRIPKIMDNLAKGINSFKKGLKEGDDDVSTPVSSVKESDPVQANKAVETHIKETDTKSE